MNTTRHAFVGCLACYAAGDLRGEWCGPDEIDWRCPLVGHEESWCLDIEGLPRLMISEMSPVEFSDVCAWLDRLEREGHPIGAAVGWLTNTGTNWRDWDEGIVDDFCDALLGEFSDGLRGYAEQIVDELPAEVLATRVLGGIGIGAYLDLDAIVRDLTAAGCWELDLGEGARWCFQPT